MPRGLYLKIPTTSAAATASQTPHPTTSIPVIHKNAIALICLDDAHKNLGLGRGYLVKGAACRGADPLLKTVVAIPGDSVVLRHNDIIVNDVKYPYPTVTHDSQGRPLKIYPRGVYSHTKGYWLIGTHVNNSWDSRYWGPIAPQQITAQLKPLLLFP